VTVTIKQLEAAVEQYKDLPALLAGCRSTIDHLAVTGKRAIQEAERLRAENAALHKSLDDAIAINNAHIARELRTEKHITALVEALAGLADEYIDRRCQFGHEYLWTKHEVTDAVNRAIRLIEKHRAESAEGNGVCTKK
jgi:hypothetical protein